MKHLALLAATSLLVASAAVSAAEPTPEHAAACVAALEADAVGMAQQVREGNNAVEPELVHRVQVGFAFIGAAYKQGLRGEEADQLLKAAQKAQESLSASELAARQAACRSEGTELLANSNVIERTFINRAAQRRVDKLKRPATG